MKAHTRVAVRQQLSEFECEETMKTESRRMDAPRAAFLLAAVLGLCVPAAAMAEEETEASASVQVSDLNLSTKGGQRKLERRVASAINSVCPDEGSAAGPRSAVRAKHRECAQAVRASVKQQLDERGSRAVAGRT